MGEITIWHNARCSKSRDALCSLNERSDHVQVVNYLKDEITAEGLEALLIKLNMTPQELIRKNEPLYLEQFQDKKWSKKKWIQTMVENPILIERPIVIVGERAVVARPHDKINTILDFK